MNSRNSKTSDRHRLLINLSGKINLKKSEKYVGLSNLIAYTIPGIIEKCYIKIINLKYQL